MASSGKFLVGAKYEADDGSIHPIRIQDETASATIGGAANAQPSGAVDSPISAEVGGSRRGIGLKARTVTIGWTADPPTGYAEGSKVKIPVLTTARYNAIQKGAVVSYQGTAGVVISKSPERVG